MSASTMTSAVSVLVLAIEVWAGPHLHIPHMAEKRAGEQGSCQGRVLCAAKRSESLDTSRAPAMLFDVGIGSRACAA